MSSPNIKTVQEKYRDKEQNAIKNGFSLIKQDEFAQHHRAAANKVSITQYIKNIIVRDKHKTGVSVIGLYKGITETAYFLLKLIWNRLDNPACPFKFY